MSGVLHVIRDGSFVCLGDATAKCHHYPSCECETWTRELHGQAFGDVIGRASSGHPLYASETIPPQPGHEAVQQESCWIEPWLQAVDLWENYDADEAMRDDGDFPDGPIEWEFHGDYLTWHYADSTVPIDHDEEGDPT